MNKKNKDENAACIVTSIYLIAYSISLYIGSMTMLVVASVFFGYVLYTSWRKEQLERRLKRISKALDQKARAEMEEE